MDADDFLEHHGIKGQRWGIRRKRNVQTGRVSSDFRTVAELRRKPIHQLTNQQLKTANERLNLEQNFRRMNPTKKEIGRKKVKALLSTVGITSVVSFVNSPLGKKSMAAGAKFITGNSIKKGISTIGRTV